MTDVLRIAHPQDCPLEGNPEVGNPEIHQDNFSMIDETQVSSRDRVDRSFARTASIKDIILTIKDIILIINYIYQPNRSKIMYKVCYTQITVTNYKNRL